MVPIPHVFMLPITLKISLIQEEGAKQASLQKCELKLQSARDLAAAGKRAQVEAKALKKANKAEQMADEAEKVKLGEKRRQVPKSPSATTIQLIILSVVQAALKICLWYSLSKARQVLLKKAKLVKTEKCVSIFHGLLRRSPKSVFENFPFVVRLVQIVVHALRPSKDSEIQEALLPVFSCTPWAICLYQNHF